MMQQRDNSPVMQEVRRDMAGLRFTFFLLLLLALFFVPVAYAQITSPAPSSVAVSSDMNVTISVAVLMNIILTSASVGMWIQSHKDTKKTLEGLTAEQAAQGDRILALEKGALSRPVLRDCDRRLEKVEKTQDDCAFSKLSPSEFQRANGAK